MNPYFFFPRPLACRSVAVGLLALGFAMTSVGTASPFFIDIEKNLNDNLPDRPVDFSPPATVGEGVNTLRPRQSCLGFCSDSFDSIRFEVPTGLQISLTEFVITGAPSSSPFGAAMAVLADDGVTVIDPPNDTRFIPTLSILSSGSLIGFNSNDVGLIHQSSVVLSPGLYDVVVLNGGHFTSEIRFTATAIPEPTSLAVFAVGTILALRRRHRRDEAAHAAQHPI